MVILWYYPGMKTAISLADDLFASADALAAKLGVSRSRLIADALTEFIARHKGGRVTERLDAIYATDPGNIDDKFKTGQRRVLRRDAW